jgi:hypothetical protein
MVEGCRRRTGGLGGTSGRWKRRRIGSVMVVLASFRHVIVWRAKIQPNQTLSPPAGDPMPRVLTLIRIFCGLFAGG